MKKLTLCLGLIFGLSLPSMAGVAGDGQALPVELSVVVEAGVGMNLGFRATANTDSAVDVLVGSIPIVSNYVLTAGEAVEVAVHLPAWSLAAAGSSPVVRITDHESSGRITVDSIELTPSNLPEAPTPGFAGLPAPSRLPIQDYARVYFPWLQARAYAAPKNWAVDSAVRDTGPFVLQMNYGTHTAVRIYYSPQVHQWLEAERSGEKTKKDKPLPDGSMIIKEMFPSAPSSFYGEIAQSAYFAARPEKYEELLTRLVDGWAIMIKDSEGGSKDGWFWTGPSAQGSASYQDWMSANLPLPNNGYLVPPGKSPDDPYDPADPPTPRLAYEPDNPHLLFTGFGLGTCIRCHASAESENTFSSLSNIEGDGLIFRVDNSWRSADYLGDVYTELLAFLEEQRLAAPTAAERQEIAATERSLLAKFDLPKEQRPPIPGPPVKVESEHDIPFQDELEAQVAAIARLGGAPGSSGTTPVNEAFVASFADLPHLDDQPSYREVAGFSLPPEFSDHVFPGPDIAVGGADNPHEYLTSDNCYGCHGGLGAPPGGFSMFVRHGDSASTGYNVSEYGEWRWSPMGLAGRDPIFHAQLESEMALLLQEVDTEFGSDPDKMHAAQQGLIDTCLRCHGAMGLRQYAIDQASCANGGGPRPPVCPPAPAPTPIGTEPFPGFNPNLKLPLLNPGFNPNLFYTAEPYAIDEPQLHHFGDEVLPPRIAGQTPEDLAPYHRYGGLAREGISCTICHRISPPDGAKATRWVDNVRAHDPDWIGADSDLVWTPSFFYFLATKTTGLFDRNAANELYGPFDDVVPKPMEHSLGITPRVAPSPDQPITEVPGADPNAPFITDSAVCGTCHTINLPNVGLEDDEYPILTHLEPNSVFQTMPHSIEQATYLEWLNSDFGPGALNRPGADFQSCQECHMPNSFRSLDGEVDIEPLVSQIATIQDAEYPQAEHSLPPAEIDVKHRSDYRRHEHVGLNAFLVQMFAQFPQVLGVDADDYETGSSTGAQLAVDNMALSAREGRVAKVELGEPTVADGKLGVEVTVTNTTGHRFPSGVAFRRAWVALIVSDAAGRPIWSSGTTDAAGVILDKDGNRLVTEFLDHKADPSDRLAQYQPHHQTITKSTQVQIYEELTTRRDYTFTNSFVHRVHHVKDNRMLPRGWVSAKTFAGRNPGTLPGLGDQGALLLELMEATDPEGASVVGGTDANGTSYLPDPDFSAEPSTGADTFHYAIPLADIDGTPAKVEAVIYSQAFMPSWFRERFELASFAKSKGFRTPETDRLYYLASHLNLDGTAIENWRLSVASDTRTVDASY